MKQQEIDNLVTEIVNNLIQQKKLLGEYYTDIHGEIKDIRNHIAELLEKKLPRSSIINRVTRKYTQGPTIINISTTKTTKPQISTQTVYSSHTTAVRSRKKPKIYNGPKGGRYYVENNKKIYLKK
jgi:predicted nuclease with TOPRIM domain